MVLILGLEGWLNGISALGVVLINLLIGFYSLYKSAKLKAKLLAVTSITIIFVGLLWLGPATDFITILVTSPSHNIQPYWLYPILSYVWAAPGIFFGMYIGGELLMPKRKWILLSVFLIICVVYEVFLLWNPPYGIFSSFNFTVPGVDFPVGSDLIDTSSMPLPVSWYPTFYFLILFILSILIFNGIGFLIKAKQATGILRKKFSYLSIGFILFAIIVVFDSVVPPMVALSIVRFGIIVSSILLYLGIRT
ncbi:MAG: hypothetical protein ACFFBH_16695 [Promethearchaeota archaeon]